MQSVKKNRLDLKHFYHSCFVSTCALLKEKCKIIFLAQNYFVLIGGEPKERYLNDNLLQPLKRNVRCQIK